MTTRFTDLDLLNIISIDKNIFSLKLQLIEYEHLVITPEQGKKLDELEKEIHNLVQEITGEK